MTENEINEYRKTSNRMFDELCDPSLLTSIDIETLTRDEVIHRFLETKLSKTDFGVMIGLLLFWEKQTSTISFESYAFYRSITKSTLVNANLARSLKNLEQFEFIRKVATKDKLEYAFTIPFLILQQELII